MTLKVFIPLDCLCRIRVSEDVARSRWLEAGRRGRDRVDNGKARELLTLPDGVFL